MVYKRQRMPTERYSYLVVIHIPFAVDSDGAVLTGELWVNDLRGMADQLGPVTVAAPCVDTNTLTPEDAGSFRLARVPTDDPQLRFLPLPRYDSGWSFLRAWRKTSRLLKQYVRDADVIHIDTGGWPFPPGELALRFVRRMNKRFILFLGDGADPVSRFNQKISTDRSPLKKLGTWMISRHFCRVFGQAARNADLTFFHNPVTSRRFKHLARCSETFARTFVQDEMLLDDRAIEAKLKDVQSVSPVRFLMAGRLIPMKGVDHALRALALARAKNADVELTIVGSGPEEKSLKLLARELAIENSVRFVGTVEYGEAMFEFFRSHHGIVVCNLTEELSRNVLLGMAFGCALVAYENPAMETVARNKDNAWLSAVGDVGSLAESIRRLSEDRDIARRLIESGVQTARRHTFHACHARRAELIRTHVMTGIK